MGKKLRSQRRGKGSPLYRAPSHRYKYDVGYPKKPVSGYVKDFINDAAKSAIVALIQYDNGKKGYMIAPEGMRVGQKIEIGGQRVETGNVLPLGEIPEGTYIFNIEKSPGDGGKFVRASGTYATVVSHEQDKTIVLLPSKQMKSFPKNSLATIGVASGGGRTEKPFVKSGKKFHAFKSKAKAYFHVSGVAMNPVDHPFGGGHHQSPSKSTTVSKKLPSGRKVGQVGAKRTGRK